MVIKITNPLTWAVNTLGAWFQASDWSVNLWASIKGWVKNWDDTARVTQEKKTKDYFEKRQQITNDIAAGRTTSWSKAQDTLTVRKNNLIQLFAADALEKWANPDKVVEITKKPDEVLKRLTSLWEWQAKAVNDYLMKGWYANRVFDYAIGKTKSPTEEYKTKEEIESEKNFLEKGIDMVRGTSIGNAVLSAMSVPAQSVSNISSFALNSWDEKDLKEYNKFLSSVSTSEYNKYKNEWTLSKLWGKATNTWLHNATEAPNYEEWNKTFVGNWLQSKADFYDSYDKAVEKGFDGSVEEYANYMNEMANNTIQWVSEATKSFLEDKLYNPDTLSSKIWKLWGEAMELALFPEFKMKWLAKAGKVWKIGKWATNLAVEWAEFQALDDIYNKELSDAWKYATAVKWNVWLGWVLKWLWSYISSIPAKEAEAIAQKTTKEWNAMSKITDTWNKKQNQTVTPYTKIVDLLTDAKKAVSKSRIKKWENLWDVRKFKLEYWEKPYTAVEALNDLTNSFKGLKDEASMWGLHWGKQALLPKFTVSKSWRTLKIENKNTLNQIVKTDWNKTIKLGDEIENIWRKMFNKQDMQINASTTDAFIREVKWVLWSEWWNGISWEWMKTIRKVFDTWDTSFKNSLKKSSKNKLKKSSSESQWSINLDKAFDEIIWRLKGTNWVAADVNLNSFSKPQIEQLFTAVKEATKWKMDLNNEIWAWIVNVSLRDPKKAQQLLETIYPSQPWATEFVIKSLLNRAKRRNVVKYTSDYTKSAWDKISDSLPWRIWATMFGWL